MSEMRVLRIGKISSINYEKGTARVTYEDRDGSTTIELPFLAWEYWMPKIEDRVVTGHFTNGTTGAVILGPLWHDDNRPIEGAEGIYRKEYENEQGAAYERYSERDKSLKIVAGGVTLTLQGGTLTVSGSMSVSGNLAVSGDLTVGGKATVAGAVAAASASTTGDMTAGGISAKSHTHTAPYGETTEPH